MILLQNLVIIVTNLLLDVSLLSGASARFAKTSMNFRLPTLDLESIEIHLENIQCSDSAILIEFADDLLLREAKEEWDSLSEFTVITSHPGCNGDGERAPYVSVFSNLLLFVLIT